MVWLDSEAAEIKNHYKEPQEGIALPNHWTIREKDEIKHQQLKKHIHFKLTDMIMGLKPHAISQ